MRLKPGFMATVAAFCIAAGAGRAQSIEDSTNVGGACAGSLECSSRVLADDTIIPVTDTSEAFVFQQFSDAHLSGAVVAEMVAHFAPLRPRFVVACGDMVNSMTAGDYTMFRDAFAAVLDSIPFFPIGGNHELETLDGGDSLVYDSIFPTLPNTWHYTLRAGNTALHCISAAADNLGIQDSRPGSALYNWLLGALATDSAMGVQHRFIDVHAPWLSSSAYTSHIDDTARKYLAPLATQYGVRAVFQGHVHGYEVALLDGVYYITSGAGGERTGRYPPVGDPPVWSLYRTWAESLFVQVYVHGDTVSTAGITRDGDSLFPLTITPVGIAEPQTKLSGFRGALTVAPNPFARSVAVEWNSTAPELGTLCVYASDGRLVRQTRIPTGVSSRVWDGRDDAGVALPPGVYVIEAGPGLRAKVVKTR